MYIVYIFDIVTGGHTKRGCDPVVKYRQWVLLTIRIVGAACEITREFQYMPALVFPEHVTISGDIFLSINHQFQPPVVYHLKFWSEMSIGLTFWKPWQKVLEWPMSMELPLAGRGCWLDDFFATAQ